MAGKKFKCPVCKYRVTKLEALIEHIESKHPEAVEKINAAGITIKQYLFNTRNRLDPFKKNGLSIISKKPTDWNEKVGRYDRILPSEKDAYRKMFIEKMVKTFGKEHLLDDPDVQKKLLASRKISGEYVYSDGTKIPYTGSYEHDFIDMMDHVMGWDSSDLMMPAPMVVNYTDPETKKKRFFMPDAFIPSLNLIIEIKASDNEHYRKRDIAVEFAKDKAVKDTTKFNYIKIFDKDYSEFLMEVKDIEDEEFEDLN